MHVTRIYTGDDGKSHFEDVDLDFHPRGEGQSEATPPANARQAFFTRQAADYVLDWHCAPGRQYVVTLDGEGEIEVGDGSTKRFGPGDVLLAEGPHRPRPRHPRSRRQPPHHDVGAAGVGG